MPIEKLKLAAYLDEAGEDPASACAVLAAHKFSYVVLRSLWSNNVCDLTDQNCGRLRKLLADHNLSTVALATDLGKVDSGLLSKIPAEKLDRVFNLASYFQAGMVKIHCGIKSRNPDYETVATWMQLITDRCLSANLVPVYEITDDSVYREPAEVAKLLSRFKRWKLLYDPVQLIVKQKMDPFERYWTLLKTFAVAVDLRDYKIGYGYKPVGYGDAKIVLNLAEGLSGKYKGWYFFEPSLGRRYGEAVTKGDTFKLAYGALENIVT